ncbi:MULTISPECIES: hypothetical protein [Bacillus cereus group]|uniref:Virion structural protein n=2 Tax=Bacillus thuringiensis TaxID=1428 RepID=A0A1W6WYU4_BACTU|nr:hypothetical protein [Bacillus thuringiensis]MEC2879368.1 hypothetical protein [Bacillus cereus]AEA19636.1 Virion structural protein [Bacillus thuringiensis serovar chinensis CT-43]AGG04451.1 Protein containing cell adhesion domain [Bacillus thuringiensis serovar thuringiensis str. IS5056]ARP61727.1 hypothetical protein CAB88_32500 [Bacillus thuringiensis]AST05374.1 hypothetical protein BT10792_33735 [Bacillus thuringiensis]
MANQLGKSLLNPESGWTRKYCSLANVGPGKFFYDVPPYGTNTAQDGKWDVVGKDDNLSDASAWFVGREEGHSFSFKFTGTALRIMLKRWREHRFNIEVSIDGTKFTGSVPATSSSFHVCFEKLNLVKGEHLVTVTAKGSALPPGTPGLIYTFLAAIDYADLGAKVGDILKEPEPDWKRFDDTDSNIKYEGVWADLIHSDFYNSTSHYKHSTSNNPPDKNPVSLKFNFMGTRVRIIGVMNMSYDANATILVDGVEEIINFFKPAGQSSSLQTLVYEKVGLMNQEHTVEIKGYFINLDAIDIDADGKLGPFNHKKEKVSLYEKESGKIFVDDFDSINPKWLMSPSNAFNNAVKKGFLRMNHSTDKDVMLLIDKPQSNFAIQVIVDYAPTKEGDEGGLLIYQNEKNKVEFLESYSSNSSQSNKEWMAICKEDQWDFYTKTDTFFDYADNDSLAAKRIGVVLKRGTAEEFVPLDINKIIMTTSNMLRLRQLYENYKVVLKDTADNILSTNIVAVAHTGIDILLPSLEFEGIIEIYDEENELIAKKQATFYGGDMYCMGSSLQIKMNSAELNTTDPTNLGYMVNNERVVKMTIVNDNIGAATNIKLSIQQYMEKVGYTWALISLDGTSYSNEIQIDSVTAQSTRDFWVKVVKDTNFLAFEPIYFNIHLKHN